MNNNHTFVILAYKSSEYLEECYNALINQTIKSKIIMTSSTPNDGQIEFAQKRNIPLIINPNRKGFADDMNFAYKNAETDFVTLVHQDDFLLPQYTELCLKEASKYPDFFIIFTDYFELLNKQFSDKSLNIKIKKFMLKTFFPFKNNLENLKLKKLLLSFGNPIIPASIFFNKKLIGEFEFKNEYKVSPEWEGLIRLSQKNGRFIYINKPMYVYRLHDLQITSTLLMERQKEDEKVFNLLWPKSIAKIFMKYDSYCYNPVKKGKDEK